MSHSLPDILTPVEPQGYYPAGVYEYDNGREIHARILDTYSSQCPYLIRVRDNGEGTVHYLAAGYVFDKQHRMIICEVHNLDEAQMGKFDHDVDFVELTSLTEPERSERINALFWSDWNEQLEDPFISPSDREEGDFGERGGSEFTKGTEAEMVEIVEKIILTDPDLQENGYFVIQSSDADELFDEDADLSARSRELIEVALRDFQFTGFDMTYTDEMDDQRAGYYRNPTGYEFSTAEIRERNSNRDILAAKNEMAEWLLKRDLKPENYL